MKFGTFATSLKPESITRNIQKAEEVGFESAWIGEHLIIPVESKSKYPYSKDGAFPAPLNVPFHDPMLALTYAAAVTSKIKLATGVFVVPLRNAITTAKAVASLDVLSNGRVIFGVGVGWWAEEFAVTGASFNDRALKTREYIELMKELWTKDEPSYHGKTITVEGVRFYPKPVQKPYPPIVVGGTSDLAIKRTVRYGDGWYAVAKSLEETRELVRKLREAERGANRSKPVEVTVSLRTGHPLTLDEVREMAAMGVERMLVGSPLGAGAAAELERFRDEIMAKV
ncbi:MAG: LLM class F420-dependent oxidoreductase [Gammaproteobacteria bacterium]